MTQPQAYLNGRFLPAAELALSVYDVGFISGITVTERLRTFGGRPFRLPEHLARLRRSLEIVGLEQRIELSELDRAARRLVELNHPLLAEGDDLGITLFVTPGVDGGSRERQPTVCLHTTPLPFDHWTSLYAQGQPLAVTDVRQVPACCWPPELKCRSRMHYYLADRAARAKQPGARAILLDEEGFVSEASTANVIVYRENEGLISPPLDKILPGISLEVTFELAADLGVTCTFRPLTLAEAAAADEIMLTSTSSCIMSAVSLDGEPVGSGAPGALFAKLLAAWSDHVGLDIAAQAAKFSNRQLPVE